MHREELKELTSLLQNREGGLLAAVINEASQEASVQNAAAGFFPAQIRLPALSEWSLSDRLNLIRRFFTQEAGCVGKKIIVGSELLICLLLYPAGKPAPAAHGYPHGLCQCVYALLRAENRQLDGNSLRYAGLRPARAALHQGAPTEIEELIPQNYNFPFLPRSPRTAAGECRHQRQPLPVH